MKNLKLSKYWSGNLLALAGYIFARDWYNLFFVNLSYSGEDAASGYGALLAIAYTFCVALAIFIVLSVTLLIEWKFRTLPKANEKLKWLKIIHNIIIYSGVVLFLLPLICIIGFMLFIFLIQ